MHMLKQPRHTRLAPNLLAPLSVFLFIIGSEVSHTTSTDMQRHPINKNQTRMIPDNIQGVPHHMHQHATACTDMQSPKLVPIRESRCPTPYSSTCSHMHQHALTCNKKSDKKQSHITKSNQVKSLDRSHTEFLDD